MLIGGVLAHAIVYMANVEYELFVLDKGTNPMGSMYLEASRVKCRRVMVPEKGKRYG